MMKIKIHEMCLLLLLLIPIVEARGQAAEYNATTNWVYPTAQKYVGLDFINSSKGELINNGTIIYNYNFTNDGKVDFTPHMAQNPALSEFSGAIKQRISGSGTTRFYSLRFSSKLVADAFSLEQPITVAHSADFSSGVVKAVQTTPETAMNMLLLESDATVANASDKGYVDGFVSKTGNAAFTFPIGNAGFYRPLSIAAPTVVTDCFTARYLYVNPDVAGYPRNKKMRTIESISNKEYWILNHTSGTSLGQLTLTWDTKASAPLMDELDLLVIARWDGSQWINEGSVGSAGNATSGSIMANVSDYGVFTLAKLVLFSPVAVNDTATTLEDVAISGDVLANDSVFQGRTNSVTGFIINGTGYKAGATATILNVGTVTIAPKGEYNFTPTMDYNGVVPAVNYIISDGRAKPDTAALILKIQPMPEFIKTANAPKVNGDGTFSFSYTMTLNNDTPNQIDNVQVEDNLDDVIKSKGCTYTVTAISATGSLKANGLYNGSSNIKTLTDGLSLLAGQKDSIIFEVKVDTQGQDEAISIANQATLNGLVSFGSISLKSRADNNSSFDPTQTELPLIRIVVPDGFSPNGDGINDLLYIKRVNNTRVEIHVYTVHATEVYSNTDYQNDWDGTGSGLLGSNLPDGTYYFTYKLTSTLTGEVVEKGMKFITLRQ